MITGLSKLILPDVAHADFFAMVKEAGYGAVELVINKEGELTLSSPADKIEEIKGLSKKYALPIVSVVQSQCTGNLLDGGEAQARSVEETVKGLAIADSLGARCTLHTLGRIHRELRYDKAYDNAVASLKMIAPEAEKLRVCLAVEFVWNGFLFSPLEMKKLLEDVGSDYVGFYFDPGNMAVFHYPEHWAGILGKFIKMVHMKDWRGNALNGGWPALLKGEVDFPAVIGCLRAAGYDGPMISEVETKEAPLAETAAAIDKIIAGA